MSNSTWSIFPPKERNQRIDLLAGPSITGFSSTVCGIESRALFSQSIQLVSEDAQLFEQVCEHVAEDSSLGFLLVQEMPLYALISPYLVSAYMQQGHLCGLSVNRDVNMDDTYALMSQPRGHILLLSLNADTYFKLGLVGKRSTLNKRKNIVEKYRIEIPIDSTMAPHTKHYKRVLECLKRTGLKADFLLKWAPIREASVHSPNSLFGFFEYLKTHSPEDKHLSRLSIHQCYPTVRTHVNKLTSTFSGINRESTSSLEASLRRFIEWTGAQVAQVNAAKLHGEEPTGSCTTYCIEIRGFFSCHNVDALLRKLTPYFESRSMGAMVVHAFEDSPQTWSGRNNEHYKDVSGESVFGVGQWDGTSFSWIVTDAYDFGIEKL